MRGRGLSKQGLALQEAKLELENLLLQMENVSTESEDAKLYLCNKEQLNALLKIDEKLNEFKNNTKRNKIYSIDSLVKIINTEYPAYWYKKIQVEKYQLVTDQAKCLKYLKQEIAISENFYNKKLEDKIMENNYSKEFIQKLREENDKIIKQEKEDAELVLKNPGNFTIKISSFRERKVYTQLNYAYDIKKYNKIKRKQHNTHLTKKKPSVLYFENNSEYERYRADMQTKYLEEKGFKRITRKTFIKEKK